MMGEYVLYYDGKVVGGIYDDRLLVKNTPSSRSLVAETDLQVPYDGVF
jgi:TfoX/Sxy family transcriptional regulator of competence genes